MTESGDAALPPQTPLTPENSENAVDTSHEIAPEQVNETSENHESVTETPEKRKRGRPRKNPIEKSPPDGAPVIKRPRGRPKGSKNKNPKPKPIVTGPKRPRGRPRKWPPVDKSAPKRGRGRPRKDGSQPINLPTMVQVSGTVSTTHSEPVASPIIANDPVPPDDLFDNGLETD